MELTEITAEEILFALTSMENNKADCCNKILTEIIKEAVDIDH